MSRFHPSKLVAGAVGGAGWRPWGLSNVIMAIFSDTCSLVSGLSFCEVPGGRRLRDLGRAGPLDKKRPWVPSQVCSEAGQGVLVSNLCSSFHPHKDRDSSHPVHLHSGAWHRA